MYLNSNEEEGTLAAVYIKEKIYRETLAYYLRALAN